MNQLPDDPKLTNFLQQYRPPTPPAAPDLEDRVLQLIAATEPDTTSPIPTHRAGVVHLLRRSHPQWLVSAGIAASLIVGFGGYRWLMPSQPNAADMASLEAFIEASWQNTVNNNSEGEMFPISDSTTN